MPGFKDFKDTVAGAKPTGVAVDAVREGAQEVGNELTDLAKLIIKVKASMQSTESAALNKDLVKTFSNIDKNFKKYFKNQEIFGSYLKKMVDPKFKMNKQEVLRMKRLTDYSRKTLSSINRSRAENSEYDQQVTEAEKKYGYDVKKQTDFDEEAIKYEKKYNIDTKAIWEKISGNLQFLQVELVDEMKQTLIMGLGGPWAIMIKDLLSPFWDKFKDSPMFNIAKAKVLGLFKSGDQKKEDGIKEAMETLTKQTTDASKSDLEKEKEPIGISEVVSSMKAQMNILQSLPDNIAKALALRVKMEGKTEEELKELNDKISDSGEIPSDLVSDVETIAAKAGLIQALLGNEWDLKQDVWLEQDKFREETRLFYKQVLDALEENEGKGGGGFLGGAALGTLLSKFGGALAAALPWILRFTGLLSLAVLVKGDSGPEAADVLDIAEQVKKTDLMRKNTEVYGEQISAIDEALKGEKTPHQKSIDVAQILAKTSTADIIKNTAMASGASEVNIEDILQKGISFEQGDIEDLISEGIGVKYKGEVIATGGQKKRTSWGGVTPEEGYLKKFKEADLESLTKVSSAIEDLKTVDFKKFGFDPTSESIKQYEVDEALQQKQAKEFLEMRLAKEKTAEESNAGKNMSSSVSSAAIAHQKEKRSLGDVSIIEDNLGMMVSNMGKH